jgi:hypothetical protein
MHIRTVRRLLKKFSNDYPDVSGPLSVDQVLDLACSVAPSRLCTSLLSCFGVALDARDRNFASVKMPRRTFCFMHSLQPGPRGGKLFEAFVGMCASDDLYSKFSRDSVRNDVADEIDTSPYENFRCQSKLRFYSWLMMHTHTRKKLVQQRNLISFVTHFHGLTRSGLDILSRAGICSPRTTFNSWWQSAIEAQSRRARSSIFATYYDRTTYY